MIAEWSGKAGIQQLCRVLEVSRSGYYASRARAARPTGTGIADLQVTAVFQASGKTYGSRRVSAALRDQGVDIGRYRARTLMKANGLRPRWRRKFVHTTDSSHCLATAPNVLNRCFMPLGPNQAWVSDLTYIRTRGGWLYLAAVLDLYSRKIVGWAMDVQMTAQLVCDALEMAIASRKPSAPLIVHSDQGVQYASTQHRQLLAMNGFTASMSRRGNCWDNAVMERFFLNLKMERTWHKEYANHAEARSDVADYIVGFYNSVRLHSTLENRSPNEHEKIHSHTTSALLGVSEIT
jgi:putative transposase